MSVQEPRVFVEQAAPGDATAAGAAVEALFQRLPAAARLGAETRVFVKLNLLSKAKPERAVTTHPDVLRAVIRALQRRGVLHITVGDSPGGPYTPAVMRGVYQACGVAAVCDETGAEAYLGCRSGPRAAAGRMVREFTLIEPVLHSDFIVNLPKMKTHVLTGLSGAVKNLFGTVPGLQKAEFHMRFPEREHFCDMLVDLCETVRADIHLVDGILAMEGDGPGGGDARACGLLVAGENPYHVDLALCRLMGLDAAAIDLLRAAAGRGLCALELDEALLVGEAAALAPIPGYRPPRSYTGRLDFSGNLPRFLQPLMPLFSRWAAPAPRIRRKACIGCGKCAEICPKRVITLKNGKAKIAPKNCIRCFCCHEMCPAKAVAIRRNRLFGM